MCFVSTFVGFRLHHRRFHDIHDHNTTPSTTPRQVKCYLRKKGHCLNVLHVCQSLWRLDSESRFPYLLEGTRTMKWMIRCFWREFFQVTAAFYFHGYMIYMILRFKKASALVSVTCGQLQWSYSSRIHSCGPAAFKLPHLRVFVPVRSSAHPFLRDEFRNSTLRKDAPFLNGSSLHA